MPRIHSVMRLQRTLSHCSTSSRSAIPVQVDVRTNSVFYNETRSNLENVRKFLESVDTPTKQVMIEARLVEVTANPQQNYGINWTGVIGGATPQSFTYGASSLATYAIQTVNGVTQVVPSKLPTVQQSGNQFQLFPFLYSAQPHSSGFLSPVGQQLAILSVPQMQVTTRLMNEDLDTEFLANPRVVTASNQKATITILRNQPVPNLTFDEQQAKAVFSGFEDKTYGNVLNVTPVVNKDNFITMNVKPTISNKVGDEVFNFEGANVTSPIIDTRQLESNVLIKSGDTLAIGGLLQDEVSKTRAKVPILGDIPGIGYAFQDHSNARTKRNLLIFVTPTVIDQGYGTGLEDQVTGLHHISEEDFADPNGWRNNAKGAIRLLPHSNREIAADVPAPGVPIAPAKVVSIEKKKVVKHVKKDPTAPDATPTPTPKPN